MPDTPGSADPGLPSLPEPVPPDQLRDLAAADLDAAAAGLQAAVRAVTAAMAPYEQHLREARARLAEIATERRRRERAAQVAHRAGVREQAKTGRMPALTAALGDSELFAGATPLTSIHAFLSTGGEVGFGFATRPGTMAFTDGRQQRQARTWGEAAGLHAMGWDPGTPGIPGVRVHIAGSRVERVVAPDEVVVQTE